MTLARLARALPGATATAVVCALLGLFVAWPIGAVLVASVRIDGPMPPQRLKAVTEDALALLPEDRRRAATERWIGAATEPERVGALAAAFRLSGRLAPWDVKAAFTDQARAAEAALAVLAPEERAAVEAEYPVALIMLHKRVALAFQVRDRLDQAGFDRLRNATESRLGLDHYASLFTDPFLRLAARNSLALATASALATTLLAFALAFAINRGGVAWPGAARAVLLLPLVSPPVLVATATLMLFGRNGLVTRGLLDRGLGLIDADSTNLYGAGGVILAQALSFLPAALIVLDNVLRRHDGRIEEAASALGADRWRILRELTLPMAWPGIKRALVLVFILSLTDFGNPLFLGRDTPVIAGIIYDEITAFRNYPLAAALCVWLIVPCLALHLALEAIGGRRRYAAGDGTGGAPELALPRGWRRALGVATAAVASVVVLLYATMVAGAFTRIWGVDWGLTLDYFSVTGAPVGLSGPGFVGLDHGIELVWDSVRIAAVAAPIGGLLGVAIAYVVERLRPPGADLIAFLALVPGILPGIIFGIGYIVAFNVPFGFRSLSLTGTAAILVLNILFANLFVGVLAARAALQRVDRAVDEAAEILGAGLMRRFVDVTLPMLRPALLLGTLYVFVDGMTTLSSVIFLVSGDHKLAAVSIFTEASGGNYGYAAAKSVVILLLTLAAMALIAWVERGARRRFASAPGAATASVPVRGPAAAGA